MKQQIVYIPVKVKDELPEVGKYVFTFNNIIEGKVHINISINSRVKEIPDKCEKWYDEYNFTSIYSKVHTWLKPQEAFVLTPKQLNEYTKTVIKQALETGANEFEIDFKTTGALSDFDNQPEYEPYITKNSITNIFEKVFLKFKK